jgi:uncharacterized protein YjiS (DUF1127 family)
MKVGLCSVTNITPQQFRLSYSPGQPMADRPLALCPEPVRPAIQQTRINTMNTSITTASRAKPEPLASTIFQTFRSAVTQIADRTRRRRRARANYVALRDLDDHMLRDIGLTRSDVVDLQNFGRDR